MESEAVLNRTEGENTTAGVITEPVHVSIKVVVGTRTAWGATDLHRALIDKLYEYFKELFEEHDARAHIIRYDPKRVPSNEGRRYEFSVTASIMSYKSTIQAEEIATMIETIANTFEDYMPQVASMTTRRGL